MFEFIPAQWIVQVIGIMVGEQTLTLPVRSRIVDVVTTRWFTCSVVVQVPVNFDEETETRQIKVLVVPTNQVVERHWNAYLYVGTVPLQDDIFVHVFAMEV